jgi:uncharacterized glyoxalase superfamily protein PhnB/uncharacterized protein YndB with AHSA1/START domain
MGARSEALAKEFEAKAQEALAVLEALSDRDWTKVTEAEQWTVGVTAHHLAGAFEPVAGIVSSIVAGRSLGHFTRQTLDDMNARHATEHAGCTRAETIALFKRGVTAAAAVVRGLSDEQLAKSGTVFADAPPMTAEQMIAGALIGHTDAHVASIRNTIGGGAFVISRVFDAPRDLVWKAWTDPVRLRQWWGPKGVSVLSANLDLRPGGVFHYGLRTPTGDEMWGKFVYREIVEPERLVFVVSFSDKDGGVTRHPFVPNWPMETLSTVTFEERDGKTRLTVQWRPHQATEIERKTFDEGHASMQQGWTGTLDQFAAYLARTAFDVQPYLFFEGRCEEALDFYRGALGAEVTTLLRFKDSPEQAMVPPGGEHKVMHSSFRIGTTTLMASDGRCGGRQSFEGFSLSIMVTDEAQAEQFFAALADGGQVRMPLTQTFWSRRFGMVADRFGVTWMINVPPQG